MPLRLLTTACLGGLRSPWPGRAYPLGTEDETIDHEKSTFSGAFLL